MIFNNINNGWLSIITPFVILLLVFLLIALIKGKNKN